MKTKNISKLKISIFILALFFVLFQNAKKAEADTTTVYASSNAADGSLGAWTNPTYVYSDDGTNFATRAGSSKNSWYGNLFGFDLSGIPDGAVINTVTITAEWKNSADDASGPVLYVGAKSGGSEVGTATSDTSGQTTFETVANSPTGLTAANLKATGTSGFWAILRFRRTDNTAHTASVDYVKIFVDYTPVSAPTVTTQDASSVEATTATGNGNITATGGANATRRGFCYMTGTLGDPTTSNSTAYDDGSYSIGSYTKGLTGLSSGTNYRVRAYAVNTAGTGYGTTVQILTKPAAPTNVSATDGTYTDKVTITWTKSTGATDYHVWRDSTDLGSAGDVSTFDDTGAAAPTITGGSASASDGTSADHVSLSLSGSSANNGTTHTYKVVASNATGNSADSGTNTGYRGVGSLTYQWQRSAADSDASYSNISGGTTASYDDTGAPSDGSGRYYKCVLNATGATQQTSSNDRGFRSAGSLTFDIVDSGGSSVSSPTVGFSSVDYSWNAQQSTGTLGTSSQKLRVTNTRTATKTWTLTISATSGASAKWDSGSYQYDYDDTAASGRLTVDASGGTITPQGGCNNTGLSKGTSASFSGGNSITLLSADGTAGTGCYWDLTGVALTQDIPAGQADGAYSISMTITAS